MENLLKGCCRRRDCYFLDGALQNIPDDIELRPLEVEKKVRAVVGRVFNSTGDEQDGAIKELGVLLSCGCPFVEESAHRLVSRRTGFGPGNPRIPSWG